MINYRHWIYTALAASAPLTAMDMPSQDALMLNAFTSGLVVDLREPTFSDGTISSVKGGVIVADDIRIQAREIRFTQKIDGDAEIARVEAEGEIMFEYCNRTFVAERLEYDLITREGRLWCGRTGIKRWYVGGECFQLNCDGSFSIEDAFVTTCENIDAEWQLRSTRVHVHPDGQLNASSTQIRFMRIPILWVPAFGANLENLSSAPIKYDFQVGGHQGPRVSLMYQAYQGRNFGAWLRFDYRLERGPAVGFETFYESDNGCETFDTISYYARDSSGVDDLIKHRYMLKGRYHNEVNDYTTVHLNYERYSDEDMETDYYDKNFEFRNAGRTELWVHTQTDNYSAYFLTRLRLNSFQNIKEELPSFDVSSHPTEIGRTGIINDNRVRCGYYQFRYADGIEDVNDYRSVRVEGRSRLYRSSCIGCLTYTPSVEGIAVAYSHSPGDEGDEGRLITVAHLELDAESSAYKLYPGFKHVMTPYMHYDFYSSPGVAVERHYVFDIDDGWEKLNVLTFGMRNGVYGERCCHSYRQLLLDIYADAFFGSPALSRDIPRGYVDLTWNPFSTLTYKAKAAWDFERDKITNTSMRVEYTGSEDFAVASELRFRDAHYWRKLDRRNLILEASRSERELLDSSLSDKRATILGHMFWRLGPQWSMEAQARYGFCRDDEPSYLEYQVDLYTILRCNWRVRLSYQHKEFDDRWTIFVGLLKKPPKTCRYRPPPWG